MIATQADAKRFFVDKVLAQARAEQIRISEAEQGMLSWSESDPSFTPDPALVAQLGTEISAEDYEAKIAGLLERAYQHDLKYDGGARERWQDAYSVLGRGDHYILVMIRRELRRHLRPWWAPWR
jgi:hypothetical protein